MPECKSYCVYPRRSICTYRFHLTLSLRTYIVSSGRAMTIHRHQTIIGVLASRGGRDPDLGDRLRERSVIHLALERIPRTARAQAMDVLSSQASIAGYASVLEGARALGVLLPMLTTAAGTIKPARMIALGAGGACLQAIATPRPLRAVVPGLHVRPTAPAQGGNIAAQVVALVGNH